MCVVLQIFDFSFTHLGKGDAALSRCNPLADGAMREHNPFQPFTPSKRIAVLLLEMGAFGAPLTTPSTKRDLALPLNPSSRILEIFLSHLHQTHA
tara:strand:- start:5032 stop:5316 length:285 start_codon:yes stop_codon:yes gene_type:complete